MNYRQRKQRKIRWQIAGCITGLVAILVIGLTLNWIAYSAWICEEVPNHYSCE